MIKKTIPFCFLFLVCVLTLCYNSNAQTTDFRARLSGNISTDISKSLKAGLEYEHRFDYNLSHFDKALLEPSIALDVSKKIRIGASYRVMVDQNWKRVNKTKQRTSINARYSNKIEDFKLNIKTALQYGFDDLTNATYIANNKLVSRTSMEVNYNLFGTRFTPFVGYEYFVHLNNTNGPIANQSRLKAGTDFKISRKLSSSAYYMFENEFSIVAPVDSHVLGFGLSYKF